MLGIRRLVSIHPKPVALNRPSVNINFAGISRTSEMTSPEKQKIAFVSINEETQKMLLSFRYEDPSVKDRLYSFNRNLDEALENAILRAKKNLEFAASKKLRKKKDKDQEPPQFDVSVEDPHGKILEPYLTNREAFQTGNILKIKTETFKIVVNAPSVVRLSLPKIMIVGCPVQAYVSLEHAELRDCEFSWWLSALKYTAIEKYPAEDVQKVQGLVFLRIKGENSNIFFPSNNDVGRRIMVECEPKLKDVAGVSVREVAAAAISAGTQDLYDARFDFTKEVLPEDQFRVVSYNLLANIYAHTNFSKTVLFGYCPDWALDFDYRKHLLMREILAYNGDLLCFQEVDRSMFTKNLEPCLSFRGFEGAYCEKTGHSSEGVAIFYRKSKFDLVEKVSMTYSQAIQEEKCLEDIKEAVNANENLRQKLKDLSQMFMHLVLKHKSSGKDLIVCNTHLYFHPNADHIRLLQTLTGLRVLEEAAAKFKEGDSPCAAIFCGDFNSTPEFGVYQLFTTGHVPKDSDDWKSNPEERVHGLVAKVERKMKSACGTPEFTNYTVQFKGCLDYIFHTEEIDVDSVVPLPTEEVLTSKGFDAIPSPIFPSDHLPLIANLKFKQ